MADPSGHVIVPCMGESVRFADEGWTGPKSLRWVSSVGHGPTRIIDRILDAYPEDWTPILVVQEAWLEQFADATAGRAHILPLPDRTRGQSDTILRALEYLDRDESPIVVQDCDVWMSRRVGRWMATGTTDNIAVLHSHPDGPEIYSYAEIARNSHGKERAVRFVEKRRISPFAQTGAWRFQRAGTLRDAIREQIRLEEGHGGEFYLSGALNHVEDGMGVLISDSWVGLGTPEQVRSAGYEIVG